MGLDPQLSLATNQDIFKELKRRFPSGVLMAGVREDPGDPDDPGFWMATHNSITALGLAKIVLVVTQREYLKHTCNIEIERDFDDEEDKEETGT